MWFVQVKCLAAAVACLSAAPQAVPDRAYPSARACAGAAVQLAKGWDAGSRGAYSFRCVRR